MTPNGELLGMNQMMEILELGQAQSIEGSVELLMKAVKRWCAERGPDDDVSILGMEVSRRSD